MFKSDIELIDLQNKLGNHPVYSSITTKEELKWFVEHHIYSVWDFMSLVKYLQLSIAPASYPWFPRKTGSIRRFINEIVLEEESDESYSQGEYSSHFEIYQKGMEEIGADTKRSQQFINLVKTKGLEDVLQSSDIPLTAKNFIGTTFSFINTNKLHIIASAFTYGRETIVPEMFSSIIKKLGVGEEQCPTFYYYINRHIEVDDIKHGPMAISLLKSICGSSPILYSEALEAAKVALRARIKFWDGILEAVSEIEKVKSVKLSALN